MRCFKDIYSNPTTDFEASLLSHRFNGWGRWDAEIQCLSVGRNHEILWLISLETGMKRLQGVLSSTVSGISAPSPVFELPFNSWNGRKLILMQMLLVHRHANELSGRGAIDSVLMVMGALSRFVIPYRLPACLYVCLCSFCSPWSLYDVLLAPSSTS